MATKENRLERLYDKAAEYHRNENAIFNDSFKVYAESLYIALSGSTVPPEEQNLRYSIFHNLLENWISHQRKFNKDKFTKELNSRFNKKQVKNHTFYFGVHVVRSSEAYFPIKRQLTIKGVKLNVVTYESFKRATKGIYFQNLVDEYKKQNYTNDAWIQSVIHREYVYFKATTASVDETISANRIMEVFELFASAATLAQERGTKVQHWGSGQIKTRRPIQTPYLFYWKEAKNEYTSILTGLSSKIRKPDGKLTFTNDEKRIKSFNRYLRIISKQNPRPIEARIRELSLEFNNALGVSDPHLRMLSLWRCLEIATRFSNGATRRQKDIISILSKYYTNDYWKEQGNLILSLRNGYVHQGKQLSHQNRDDYLGWFQDYVSASLSQLMWMHTKSIGITDETEIDAFFDLYTMPYESLGVAKKMHYELTKSRKEA